MSAVSHFDAGVQWECGIVVDRGGVAVEAVALQVDSAIVGQHYGSEGQQQPSECLGRFHGWHKLKLSCQVRTRAADPSSGCVFFRSAQHDWERATGLETFLFQLLLRRKYWH